MERVDLEGSSKDIAEPNKKDFQRITMGKINNFIHDLRWWITDKGTEYYCVEVAKVREMKAAEIEKGNMSVAIVDAAALIATALIIRATLVWAHGLNLDTLIAILSGFAISQTLLVIITRLRERAYRKSNQGACFQDALIQGQIALAIRHAGFLIAMGFTLTAASNFLTYEPTAYISNLLGWLGFGSLMVALFYGLVPVVKKIVLSQINLTEEVDLQHNIGVAALEFVLSIAIALILMALMA